MRLYRFMVLVLWLAGSNAVASGNPVYRVRSIRVEGNKITRTAIIEREVVFKKGDEILQDQLEEKLELTRSNIINTHLFLEASVGFTADSLGMLDVTIRVKERWYWSVLPFLVLSDRSFNEWWYEHGRDLRRLTYGVNLTQYNFTGNADIFYAGVHLGFAPYYQLAYSRPYIDKQKRFGVSGRVFYTSRRNLAYRTWNDKLSFISSDSISLRRYGASADFRYRQGYNYFHTWFLGVSKNHVADTVVRANPEYFGGGRNDQLLVNAGYEYRADFRDVRQYPLKGSFFAAGISHFFVPGGKDQTNLLLTWNRYIPLAEKWFLEIGLRGKASLPRRQSYFLVSGLGYGGNIARGYELYVIDGQYFALNRNTLKVRAFERKFDMSRLIWKKEFAIIPVSVYPNVYLDYAYVRNFNPERSNSNLGNTHLPGGGVGLDIVTFYNINLRTYYSVNRMGERKLFFTVGREF
ncbi:POTRA domain-containing protein [Leadbetterella sp. DM7]|uniref:POTRA domain-containing protein n=1 Tax=Leadbetterella sp. DM7 TaxID=3235085 RepID=UPI00349ED1AC